MTPDPTVTAVSEYIPIKDLADLEDRLALWCQISEPSPLVKHSSVKEMLTASRDAVRELLRARSALADVGECDELIRRIEAIRADESKAFDKADKTERRVRKWHFASIDRILFVLRKSLGKQPRPAAEAKCECGHAKMPGMTRCLNCNDLSPAVHSAQMTEEEREAMLAGADALTAAHPSWSPQQQYAATLRRLAEQGSAK